MLCPGVDLCLLSDLCSSTARCPACQLPPKEHMLFGSYEWMPTFSSCPLAILFPSIPAHSSTLIICRLLCLASFIRDCWKYQTSLELSGSCQVLLLQCDCMIDILIFIAFVYTLCFTPRKGIYCISSIVRPTFFTF